MLKLVCGAVRKILIDTVSLIFTSTPVAVEWPAASLPGMNSEPIEKLAGEPQPCSLLF
jgi:hypothetical protein